MISATMFAKSELTSELMGYSLDSTLDYPTGYEEGRAGSAEGAGWVCRYVLWVSLLTCTMWSEVLQKILAKETKAGSEVNVEMASGCGHTQNRYAIVYNNHYAINLISK